MKRDFCSVSVFAIVYLPCIRALRCGNNVSHMHTFLSPDEWPAVASKLDEAINWKSLIVLLWQRRFWNQIALHKEARTL